MSNLVPRAWLPEWFVPGALWLRWPYREDVFAYQGQAAQAELIFLIQQVHQQDVPICLMVPARLMQEAQQALGDLTSVISWFEVDYGDVWLRDCAPFIGYDGRHRQFDFDSWGGIDDQWPLDKMARDWLSRHLKAKTLTYELVLEGGAIHTDGEGTGIACTGSILAREDNTLLSTAQIEYALQEALGITKMIWLPYVLTADETGGHIDNLACFLAPGHLALSMPTDPTHPDYSQCLQALVSLQQQTDAQGRLFQITLIPLPEPLALTQQEAESILERDRILQRKAGRPLMASYINFIRLGSLIVLPHFGLPEDDKALQIFQRALPSCQFLQVPARALIVGGGGWHCASWVEPNLHLIQDQKVQDGGGVDATRQG